MDTVDEDHSLRTTNTQPSQPELPGTSREGAPPPPRTPPAGRPSEPEVDDDLSLPAAPPPSDPRPRGTF